MSTNTVVFNLSGCRLPRTREDFMGGAPLIFVFSFIMFNTFKDFGTSFNCLRCSSVVMLSRRGIVPMPVQCRQLSCAASVSNVT